MFDKFWGDHVQGKLVDIADLLIEDNPEIMIKQLPFLDDGGYGSPQLLLSYKPSSECLDKLKEFYRVRIFTDDENKDYRYMMHLETLQYAYERGWHFGNADGITKEVTGNSYDYDGYFYITDKYNSYRKIAIIPFSVHAHEFGGGYNMSENEALILTKRWVKELNQIGV